MAVLKSTEQGEVLKIGSGPSRTQLEQSLCLISLQDRRQVEGVDLLRDLLEAKGFFCDHFEYKLVHKVETKRPINPKNPNGPTQKVTIEEKTNINGTLRGMRQLAWRVAKDSENLLHVQLYRSKGETCTLPLLFAEVYKNQGSVLVTGSNKKLEAQLTAKVDLEFQAIPPEIAAQPDLVEELIARSQRTKGFQATARELVDFTNIKIHIAEKLKELSQARKVDLTPAEAVNIILLADLTSRYNELTSNFQTEVTSQKFPPQALAKMFEDLTQGMSPSYLQKRLFDFMPEGPPCKNNQQIFANIYKSLQMMEQNQLAGRDPKIFNKTTLFGRIRSLVMVARSQFDPPLWKKSIFFHAPNDENTSAEERTQAIDQLVKQIVERQHQSYDGSKQTHEETYLLHNIDLLLSSYPLWIGDNIPPLLGKLIRSMLAEQYQMKLLPQKLQGKGMSLFDDAGRPPTQLYFNLHLVSATEGVLLASLLEKEFQKMFRDSKESLMKRFGRDFFDIFYEKLVLNPGLPITRKKFAQWLEAKNIIPRLNERGFNPDADETDFHPLLSAQHLIEPGLSLISNPKWGPKEFGEEFEKLTQKFTHFMAKLAKQGKESSNPNGICKFLLGQIQEGYFNFLSPSFQKKFRPTPFYEELHEVVVNSAQEVLEAIFARAVNQKAILHAPESFTPLLAMGNEFDLSQETKRVRVHFLVVPQKLEELETTDLKLCKNIEAHLKKPNSAERKELALARDLLNEFAQITRKLQPYLGWILADQAFKAYQILDAKMVKFATERVKYYIPDEFKLLIGDLKRIDFNKFCNFQTQKTKKAIAPLPMSPPPGNCIRAF